MSARLYHAIVFLMVTLGCTLEQQPPAEAQKRMVATSSDAASKRYGVRSGRLVSAVHRPGQATPDTTIFIFDDFGRRERSEQVVTIIAGDRPPARVRTAVIRDGRKVHTLNVDRRTARTSTVDATANEPFVNFMGLSNAELEALHVRRTGIDTILGQPCDVFAIDDMERGVVGTYHVWKNIPIRTDVSVRGSRMLITPTQLTTDINVEPSVFVIPSGFQLLSR